MTTLTEADAESAALDWLATLGWETAVEPWLRDALLQLTSNPLPLSGWPALAGRWHMGRISPRIRQERNGATTGRWSWALGCRIPQPI